MSPREKRANRKAQIKSPPPPPIDFYGRAVHTEDDKNNDLHCRPMVTAKQMVSAYVDGNRYQRERIEFFRV